MLFLYTPGALAIIFINKVLIIYQKEKKKVVFMPNLVQGESGRDGVNHFQLMET